MSQPVLFQCDCCHGEGEIHFKYSEGKVECADCRGEGYVTIDKLNTYQPPRTGADIPGPICGLLALAKSNHERGMKGSIPFKLGDVMQTISGNTVVCIELTSRQGYECARFDDGGWRYNRDYDRGRCTASRWDARKNVMPKYPEYQEDILERDMVRAMQELGNLDPGEIRMEIAGVVV
jgi:hypothetical protein